MDQLSGALAETRKLVAGVAAEQWAAATPCEGWDVRALVTHMVSGNRLFAAALRGERPEQLDEIDDELVDAFERSATDLLAAFGSPGALERVVEVPFGSVPGVVALHLRLTEILVHGWDIAEATGQPTHFDGLVAEQELEFSRKAVGAIPPNRRPFGPAQPVPADAPAIDRLAALLGRQATRA